MTIRELNMEEVTSVSGANLNRVDFIQYMI